MYRILFTIGSFSIYSYGLMIALAFIIAILLAMKEAKKSGEEPERILDLSLYVILGALIGGRLGYVLTYFDYYMKNPVKILYFRQGGLSFLGGFLIAYSLCWLYVKRTFFAYASGVFTAIKRWIDCLRKFLYSSSNSYSTLYFFVWIFNIFYSSLDEKI
jgi:phosphatidylglycerol:prolipoprotein diacylglycerol transferase